MERVSDFRVEESQSGALVMDGVLLRIFLEAEEAHCGTTCSVLCQQFSGRLPKTMFAFLLFVFSAPDCQIYLLFSSCYNFLSQNN